MMESQFCIDSFTCIRNLLNFNILLFSVSSLEFFFPWYKKHSLPSCNFSVCHSKSLISWKDFSVLGNELFDYLTDP